MSYDFPADPVEDQEYAPSVGGQTYVYKAPRWLVKGVPPSGGGGGGGLAEAPVDGNQYARQNAAWTTIVIPAGDWDSITGKPITFPPTVPIAWTDVNGKPSTYPPAVHGHPESEITNLVADLAAKAPLASPPLTGTPTAPTAATATNTTQIATTAYVKGQGYATTAYVDTADGLLAPKASPTFTGDPKAPTPAAGDNDTSVATTAFVTRDFLAKTGGTLIGDLAISKATPGFLLDKAASGQACVLAGRKGGVARWDMHFGNTTAEAGANSGSDFALNRYSDAGAYLDTPMAIVRSTGALNFTAIPTINYLPFPAVATIADAAPSSPVNGQLWFEATTGGLFIWYNDGDSSQWVQVNGTSG